MKRLKLRKWVKVTLVIVGILVLIGINNYTNKAIDQCVKSGHTKNYCENGLR